MQSKQYFLSADLVRIIAIIGVVAIHVSTPFVDYPPYFHGFSWWIANFTDSAARIAVPLFIMLSGFLLLRNRKEFLIKKRISRIALPLIIWTIIYLLWNVFFWYKSYTAESLLSSLVTPSVYHHLYFLYIMLGLYFVTPLLKHYLNTTSQKTQQVLLIVYFLAIISITLCNYLIPDGLMNFNAFTLFVPYIGYYLAGYYFQPIILKRSQTIILLLAYISIATLTAFLNFQSMKALGWTNQFMSAANYDRYFYDYFSPLVVTMAIIAFLLINNIANYPIIKNNKRIITWSKLIAPTVFGIYLIHPLLIDLVERYIPPLNIANIGTLIGVLMLLKIIIIFFISFTVVFVARKIKGLKYLFG